MQGVRETGREYDGRCPPAVEFEMEIPTSARRKLHGLLTLDTATFLPKAQWYPLSIIYTSCREILTVLAETP